MWHSARLISESLSVSPNVGSYRAHFWRSRYLTSVDNSNWSHKIGIVYTDGSCQQYLVRVVFLCETGYINPQYTAHGGTVSSIYMIIDLEAVTHTFRCITYK